MIDSVIYVYRSTVLENELLIINCFYNDIIIENKKLYYENSIINKEESKVLFKDKIIINFRYEKIIQRWEIKHPKAIEKYYKLKNMKNACM